MTVRMKRRSNKYTRKHTRKLRKPLLTQFESYIKYLHLGKTESPDLKPIEFTKQNSLPHTEIIEISKKILLDIIHKSTYSVLPYYFMQQSIPIKYQDDYVSKYNSGNCVFFAKKVLRELKTHGIHGYLIPATTLQNLMQPDFPEFCHCVVLVKSENFFILYEPAFYILEPIVINIDGTPTPYRIDVYEKEWLYTYDSETNRINVTDRDGNHLLYYNIMNILNPTLAISYPVNIHNKRLPIVRYDAYQNRKRAHLSVRLDTKCLEGYNVLYDKTNYDGWFPRFDYNELLDMPISDKEKKHKLSLWIGLSTDQCKSLLCNKTDLINKIYDIIKYNHKL